MRLTSHLIFFEDGKYYNQDFDKLFDVTDFSEKRRMNEYISRHKHDEQLISLFLESVIEYKALNYKIKNTKKIKNEAIVIKGALENDPNFMERLLYSRDCIGLKNVPFWDKPVKTVDEAYKILVHQRLANNNGVINTSFPVEWQEQIKILPKGVVSTSYFDVQESSYEFLLNDFNLSCGWQDYVIIKMAAPNFEPPVCYNPIIPMIEEYPVRIKYSSENGINITMTKKSSKLMLEITTKTLKQLIGEPDSENYEYGVPKDGLYARIVADNINGMSYGDLAKKYAINNNRGGTTLLNSAVDNIKSAVAYSKKKNKQS